MKTESGKLLSRASLQKAERPPAFVPRTERECVDVLAATYRRALEKHWDTYVERHSRPNSLRRQVDAFSTYRDYLPLNGRILEWGCKHAPDACLMRFVLGDEVEIDGYDFDRGDIYEEFYTTARMKFVAAGHTYLLPYGDESFDAVLGSGVLEHVAVPSQSLTELYRVVRVGGTLIIMFLPNRLSWTEWALRRTGSHAHHRRLYTRRSVRRLLLNHGFEPQIVGYHQFVPGQRGGRVARWLWPLNGILERLPPSKFFCANLYVIAVNRRAI